MRDRARLIIHDNGGVVSIAVFFVVMAVTFSLITDTFLTQTNLLNILRQIAPLMIVAVAMTFVITTAGIDLSVGSVLALVNALAAISLQAGLAWPLVIVLMLGVGIVIGLFQGFFIAYEGIPAFIVTLAGLSSIRGTALLLTKGYSIPIDPQSPFNAIGRGWVFGLPMPAIIAVVVLALGFLVFNETTFGRYVTGVGANAEAVRRAGVDTKRITLAVYALSGFAAAIAGIIIAGAPRKRILERRRGLRTRGHRRGRAGRNEPVRRPRHDARHDARGADRRGDRQRPHPLSYVAVHHADRRGLHHSHRGLAELPPVPHGAADELRKAGANMAKPTIGVHSGLVRTVLGPIPVEAMGVTLMHEHILLDASSWWKRPCCGSEIAIAERPLDISMIGDLRMNPFLNRDNCGLLDVRAAIEELNHFVEYGGKTVVDPTNLGIGRDPSALQRISRRTGLNIVMGAGFYLEPSHPPYVKDMTVETIAEAIARDCGLSEDEPEVCAGIIGEIGISKDFTPAEEKVLRGAARASKLSGAPLSIHLPGWERHAHRVLDVVESEGADLRHVVLCHMNPSLHDPKYQRSLADRGAFIEYDMIGMDFFYADQQAQSPCDEENAIAICRLVDDGYLNSILMSQDVFLKMMLCGTAGLATAISSSISCRA